MAVSELVVIMGGARAGVVERGARGRLAFAYDEAWRHDPEATPLSVSMPLASPVHEHRVVEAFLWGLLPDSERVLDRWARDFHVSARNPFALLGHVGEECAGAAQFVRPERVDTVIADPGQVEWLTDADVAAVLARLRRDPTAWHASAHGEGEGGWFSLAGAQAKTALRHEDGRWGRPHGSLPTTHILKPALPGFEGHDVNEHLCLRLARSLGMAAARSQVRHFEDERAIVVERYDRLVTPGGVVRVHQEDMCQALAVPPTAKYQSDGGPSPEQIVGLLREVLAPQDSARAVTAFVEALALNWVIAGTDCHAKNYALLLAGPQIRLAPLYDVASALPYPDLYPPKFKLAMKIGGRYLLSQIHGRAWRRFAEGVGLDPDDLVARLDDLTARVPDTLADECADEDLRAVAGDLPARLLDAVAHRAASCRSDLTLT